MGNSESVGIQCWKCGAIAILVIITLNILMQSNRRSEGAYNYSTARPALPWEYRRFAKEELYQQVFRDVDRPWLDISPGPGVW